MNIITKLNEVPRMKRNITDCLHLGRVGLLPTFFYSVPELEKVPSSASVLVRKDFGIRENLRKAQGGKKIESPTILGKEKHKEKNNLKIFSWRVVVL